MTVLNILMQNKDVCFEEILGNVTLEGTGEDKPAESQTKTKAAGEYTAEDIEF